MRNAQSRMAESGLQWRMYNPAAWTNNERTFLLPIFDILAFLMVKPDS